MDEAANPKDSDEESCSPRTGPLPTPVTQPVERLDPRDVAGPDAIQDPLLTDSLPHPTREISPQVAKFWPPNPAPKMLKLYPKTTEETLARIKPMEHEVRQRLQRSTKLHALANLCLCPPAQQPG